MNQSSLPPALEALRDAAQGLQFPSETDAPFEVFFWPGVNVSSLTTGQVAELAGTNSQSPVEIVSLTVFFRHATEEEEWHNDEEKAEVERFEALVKAIKAALNAERVYCIGKGKKECFIVGGLEGGCGGLKTQVVET